MLKECIPPQTLEAYASHHLDVAEVARVETHLEGCEVCCVALSQIVDTLESKTHQSLTLGGALCQSVESTGSNSSSGNPAYRYWAQQSSRSESATMPSMIGRYRVEKLLGTGGFGRVYAAVDDKLDRRVAIKVPHTNIAAQQSQLALIQAEAKTVACMDHPNIVPIYDVGTTDEFPVYLVTKLIDGHSLATLVNKGITAAGAVSWTIQIAEALAYAHQNGIIHRDIKPQNILIDSHSQARLTDFGLAWRGTHDRTAFPNAGTPAYMSPEQRKIGEPIDHRTDIYSLGRVLEELVTSVSSTSTNPNIEVLLQICDRAMAEKPTDRFGSAEEFAGSLRSYAASQGWSNVPTTLLTQSQTARDLSHVIHSLTNWRTWLILSVVAGVALLGVSTWQNVLARQREAANIVAYLAAAPNEITLRKKQLINVSSNGMATLREAAWSADSDARLRAQIALLDSHPEFARDIANAMLDAHVDLASTIANELMPHKQALKDHLLAALHDETKLPYYRLNASSFLAQGFAKDPLWEETAIVELVARLLQDNLLSDLQAHIRAHVATKAPLIKHMRALVMSHEDRADPQLARALVIWDELTRDDEHESVNLLIECPVEMADKVIPRLKESNKAKQHLRALLAVEPARPQAPSEFLLYRAKFMAAYALLQLGSPDEFWRMFCHSPSPDQATVAAFVAADSPVTLSLIANQLSATDSLRAVEQLPSRLHDRLYSEELSARRQLVHGLFRVPRWRALNQSVQDKLLSSLRMLIVHEADPGLHAQATWILKGITPPAQWGDEPWFPKEEVLTATEKRAWSLNSLSMVMVDINQADNFDHDFALSQREVEARFFDEFVKDTGYDWAASDSSNWSADNRRFNPQNFVSWYDCAAFCNWLSRREGLDECYTPNAAGKYAAGMSIKPNLAELNGYRLPLATEWEICCRAGAATRFANGDLERYLAGYAWTFQTTRELTPTGHKPPNALGFFDMHGNVSEWTLDDLVSSQTTISDLTEYPCRGGDFQSQPVDCTCDHLDLNAAPTRQVNIGFRIARTLKSSP